ncbi:MAG: hypothetical protein IIC59_06445 [Proteobacteria bacterium]|nr:hypothetical protein [Pseudomonadota bacterium]
MRELTETEISQVSGGSIGDFAANGGAVGTIVGGVITNTIRGAMMGGAYGALGGAVLGAGYYTSRWIVQSLS